MMCGLINSCRVATQEDPWHFSTIKVEIGGISGDLRPLNNIVAFRHRIPAVKPQRVDLISIELWRGCAKT